MRIALVSEHYLPHVGGIERHVAELGKRLAELNHEVHIITTTPGPSEIAGIPVHRFGVPLIPVVRIPFTPLGILRLEDFLREQAFDLVHCHHSIVSPSVACAAYQAQRMGVPTVVTFHSILDGYAFPFRFLDRISAWSRWPVVFSAVSSGVAKVLQDIMPARDALLLSNGVDSDFWQKSAQPKEDRIVRIVSTLRLAPRKRPLALIRIAAQVQASLPLGAQFRLLIIGDGPERERTQMSIESLGLGDVVELAGHLTLEEIRAEYACSHLFSLASVEESFGLAALEASSSGLPVVARRGPGLGQFIQQGENGFLADSDEEMVTRLVQLVTDRQLRERMSSSDCSPPPAMAWPRVLEAHLEAYAEATDLARTERF